MPYVPPPQPYRPDPLEMEFMNQRLAILESDMPDERKKAALREARARYERQMAMKKKLMWRLMLRVVIYSVGCMAMGFFLFTRSQQVLGTLVMLSVIPLLLFDGLSVDHRIRNA